MNRALPFLAAVTLMGGGLAYFATQTGMGMGSDSKLGGLDVEPPARSNLAP